MTRLVTPAEFDREIAQLRRLLSDWRPLYPLAYDLSLTKGGAGLAQIPQRGTVTDAPLDLVEDLRRDSVRQALRAAHGTVDAAAQRLVHAKKITEYGIGLSKRGWDQAEAQAAEDRAARRRKAARHGR